MPKFADMNKFKQLTTYNIEMFYLNSTINFGIPLVLVFQLEVYCKVDRLLTGLTAQKKEQLLNGIQIKCLYVSFTII